MDVYDIIGLVERKGIYFSAADERRLEETWKNMLKTDGKPVAQYRWRGAEKDESGELRIELKKTVYRNGMPYRSEKTTFMFHGHTRHSFKLIGVPEETNFNILNHEKNKL